jgi:transcriptional regulator
MSQTYIPPHARADDRTELESLVRTHPLATLISSVDSDVSVSHLPMLLETTATGTLTLRGHVARANPHWRAFESASEALAIFHGPQAYVTPQWYPSKAEHAKVVPTWNYAVVHVQGTVCTVTDAAWLHAHVGRLTDTHEAGFAHQWKVTDAPSEYIDKMLSAIVGLEMTVTRGR